MPLLASRPALRWLVPAAATAVVIGGGAAIGSLIASADPSLPPRSAAQLLVDVQTARLDGLSGTVVLRADLGLPSLPGAGDRGSSDISTLISGKHTLRVWYAGPDQARVALVGTLGETDMIRNGRDVWVWKSRDNTATHSQLPETSGTAAPRPLPSGLPDLPATPQEAADRALAALAPSTEVTTGGSARVAGRRAYELVLRPRDTGSLVESVNLAIDSVEHVPLRVEVYAKGHDRPAFEVAFQRVSFDRPDAEQFRFNPPPGAKVTEESASESLTPGTGPKVTHPSPGGAAERDGMAVVGESWTSVLVARVPEDATSGADGGGAMLRGIVERLPRVSGSWGSGHLLRGTLFTALLTDDGRLLVGAVSPDRLYQAAADPAAQLPR